MKSFADLYAALDATTRTSAKVDALARYFTAAAPAEAAWAVYFLAGRKPRQVVPAARLAAWAMERAATPAWLFSEAYDAVGDIAETIALLVPRTAASSDRPLDEWLETRILPLRGLDEARQRAEVLRAWDELDVRQLFVWNKLVTGGFRVGVSAQLVTRALAQVSGLPADVLAHRLMGDWQPTPDFYARLLAPDTRDADLSRPYPFFLAHPLEDAPASLGDPADWRAEWKWDGIRAQLIRRAGKVFLWTRGEELVTDRHPELAAAAVRLPDGTVLDGEILPWRGDSVLPFAQLQRRIGRKTLGKKLLQEVPVVLVAYDLLEHGGRDLRPEPLTTRRHSLETLLSPLAGTPLRLSPLVPFAAWDDLARLRQDSRARLVEGLMLKRRDSPYRVGRVRGDWWKWKIAPHTVDAVMTAAQRGHGKRASLYTDYTFSVWHHGQLVPFAKAYSGLTDDEIRQVDAWVRRNTLEKFGPVRSVRPELVFELAFEALQRSNRHRSGVAVRFPRILRWRTDKKSQDADTLDRILALLPPEPTASSPTLPLS